jgi:hypothetical protein
MHAANKNGKYPRGKCQQWKQAENLRRLLLFYISLAYFVYFPSLLYFFVSRTQNSEYDFSIPLRIVANNWDYFFLLFSSLPRSTSNNFFELQFCLCAGVECMDYALLYVCKFHSELMWMAFLERAWSWYTWKFYEWKQTTFECQLNWGETCPFLSFFAL